jgi:hypothetical protein
MSSAVAMSGYSGTPLAVKLGVKDGMAVAFAALPAALELLAECADFTTVDRTKDWAGLVGQLRRYDFIQAFTRERAEIETHLGGLQNAIKADGMIWVSWPKKATKIATDVTEDVVRSAALKLDLVDVKVAAIDDVWSGLKLVIRKERRR